MIQILKKISSLIYFKLYQIHVIRNITLIKIMEKNLKKFEPLNFLSEFVELFLLSQ